VNQAPIGRTTRTATEPGRIRAARGDRGAVLIEFALTLPLFLLLMVGMFDFGFAIQKYLVMTNAAREGARVGVLPGYGVNDVEARVQGYLTAGGVADVPTTTVTTQMVSACAGCPSFNVVEVNVRMNYTFSMLGPIATLFGSSFGTISLSTTSVMRTEVAAGG